MKRSSLNKPESMVTMIFYMYARKLAIFTQTSPQYCVPTFGSWLLGFKWATTTTRFKNCSLQQNSTLYSQSVSYTELEFQQKYSFQLHFSICILDPETLYQIAINSFTHCSQPYDQDSFEKQQLKTLSGSTGHTSSALFPEIS